MTVDLAAIRDGLAFPPTEARLISGYWRQQLLDVCDYAETLAAEVERLERIANSAHRYLSLQGTGTVGEAGALIKLREAVEGWKKAS